MNFPSAYEFACGACLRVEDNGFRVVMHREGGVYHVCAYADEFTAWHKSKVVHTMTEAKKVFKRYARITSL